MTEIIVNYGGKCLTNNVKNNSNNNNNNDKNTYEKNNFSNIIIF